MTLPLLISVPHAGLDVPADLRARCLLTPAQIAEDGDEGAGEIYAVGHEVAHHVTTTVARAIVDLNRAEDDRRPDGVVKTHTCFNVPVYRDALPDAIVDGLLARHHRPYHHRLTDLSRETRQDTVRLAIDCHTMLAVGPPIGPGAGVPRPQVCLSHADGTCPRDWTDELARCFADEFDGPVTINDPFTGGYITRRHGAEMPWVQLELSRAPFATNAEKRRAVLRALTAACRRLFP